MLLKPMLLVGIAMLFQYNNMDAQNLIRNGSFELNSPYDSFGKKWSVGKKQFDKHIKFWNSPTAATPDIILDEYRELASFERPKLDITPCLPRTGTAVVAIRSYGCKTRESHCREYLQAKTKQILKKGCAYDYEFYAQPAVKSIRINNLGIAFAETETTDMMNYELLEFENAQPHKEIVYSKLGEWVKISGTYIMDKDYEYIIIGNFFNDDDTKYKRVEDGMQAAYYLIDDVSINFRSCPVGIKPPPVLNNKITLANILFDNDSAILKSSLEDVYQQIINQDYDQIQITGYTDKTGSAAYNKKLSFKRANAVMTALKKLGIPQDKMKAIGEGSQNSISETQPELNRRVVLLIK